MENFVKARVKGTRLQVEIGYPEETREILLELHSDKNKRISDFKEISPWDDKDKLHTIPQDLEGEMWFPAVDVKLLPGMYGKARVSGIKEGMKYTWNGWLWPEKKDVRDPLIIEDSCLLEWENGCFFDKTGGRMEDFCLCLRIPVFLTISRKITKELPLLDKDWSGRVTAYYKDSRDEFQKVGCCRIEKEEKALVLRGDPGLSRASLEDALEKNLEFILKSRITSEGHPFEGGFHLFYDLEGHTYRLPGWLWGWGPVIRALLDSSRIQRLQDVFGKDTLRQAALQAGAVTLKGQVFSNEEELNGLGTARWDPNLTMESGYRQRVCGASDSGFLCGWAWCALYRETGDPAFLEAALAYSHSAEKLVERYKIPPQDYMPEEGCWSAHTLDESGFGVKAFEALYEMTGEEGYRQLGRAYIENHLEKFQREDGLWERMYLRERDSAEPCMYMTRGQGWAMEGLLSAWNLTKDERYKEKACRMAETVLSWQKEDGSWNFILNRPEEEAGADDKGTPLWSLLLYRLYQADPKEKWLEGARKALGWCLSHQIIEGEEGSVGGLACPTPQSGVVYRPWFPMACLYTAGFFILALLEEMKLKGEPQ